MNLKIAFIIPVFNRETELRELLASMEKLRIPGGVFPEVVVVDDGSEPSLKKVTQVFRSFPVHYYYISNSGPGAARNYGMNKVNADYYIILDSDVILPADYLENLINYLRGKPEVDLAGGPDDVLPEFSGFQKAVNLVMTSPLTTGGIRGSKRTRKNFVPRSFNMLVRRKVFDIIGGFGDMHPGEDPEWVYRARRKGFQTDFIPALKVYHKRRTDLLSFFNQIYKFGMARAVLSRLYPESQSVIYFFPLFFVIYFWFSVLAVLWRLYLPLFVLIISLSIIFILHAIKSRSFKISLLSVFLFIVQMHAYAMGFILTFFNIIFRNKNPKNYPDKIYRWKK